MLLDAEMASLITMVGLVLPYFFSYFPGLVSTALVWFDPELPKIVCQLSNQRGLHSSKSTLLCEMAVEIIGKSFVTFVYRTFL